MRARAAVLAGVVGLALAVGLPAAAAAEDSAPAAGSGVQVGVTVPERSAAAGSISNAELRWGLNRESGSGAFFGGCNFLSAGKAGSSGSSRVWTAGDGLYSAQSGAVSIVRAGATGWTPATFDTKCLDAAGAAVSVASTTSATGNQVVISGGTGSVDASGVSLRWTGSFTVAFYGGMTYWSVTDPVLRLDATGSGSLTGTASGYGADRDDPSVWRALTPRTITLARISGASVPASGGFSAQPDYLGVTVAGVGQVARDATNSGWWGAFPADFVDFQTETGQTGYWLSTGGQRDPAKAATPITVNYDAAAPAIVPDAGAAGGASSGADPQNAVRFRPDAVDAGLSAVGTNAAGASPATVARDDAADLVPVAGSGMPAWALPLGGAALALVVSGLAVLQILGRLPWPHLVRHAS